MTTAGPETFAAPTQPADLGSPELAQAFITVGSVFQLEPDHVSVFDSSRKAARAIPAIIRFGAHQKAIAAALRTVECTRDAITNPFSGFGLEAYVWSDGTPAERGNSKSNFKIEDGVSLSRLQLGVALNRWDESFYPDRDDELSSIGLFDTWHPGSCSGESRHVDVFLYGSNSGKSLQAEEFVFTTSDQATPQRLQFSTLANGGTFTRHIDDRAFGRRASNYESIFGPTGYIEYKPFESPSLPGVKRFLDLQRQVFARYVQYLPEEMREVMPTALQKVAERLPQPIDMDTDENLVPISSWNKRDS